MPGQPGPTHSQSVASHAQHLGGSVSVQAVYRHGELDSPWPITITAEGRLLVLGVPGGTLRINPDNADLLRHLLAAAAGHTSHRHAS